MSSPSLTSTATLTSHSSSPNALPSNVATPGWATCSLSTEHNELWFPKHTPPSSGSSFPTPSPLSISPPVVTSSSPPTLEILPVLSVNFPVHYHHLCLFPSPTKHTTLVTAITDPHLVISFNHYFDDGCPFEALYKAYLQVEYLSIIVNSSFMTHNLIAPTVKHIACNVQTRLRVGLVSVMHQLDMTDFIVDLNQYLKELASTQNLIEEAATASKNSTPSASSSPLTKEEETALECIKVWWTGSNYDTSLSHDHP